MQDTQRVPYSRVGLERLAQAMNVTSAALWFSPVRGGLSIRDGAADCTKQTRSKQASISNIHLEAEEEEAE